MEPLDQARARLAAIPGLTVIPSAPLAAYTRFGIGGPADLYAETADSTAFAAAMEAARSTGLPAVVIGDGTNLIASDSGFRGIVLRYRGQAIAASGSCVDAEAGAVLQDLVDCAIAHALEGIETLAGIPGSVGAAIYGNAGAYGRSISESVESVRFCDGSAIRSLPAAECGFAYRESVFKKNKGWVILSARLVLHPGDAAALRRAADDILAVRDRKFPVTMKCAGSIFKNLLYSELPPALAQAIPPTAVREGKVAAAWFLEQVGAKGMTRGDIHVADYHANLIYNGGSGAAADLTALIRELKQRVRARFGINLEEEVQYIG